MIGSINNSALNAYSDKMNVHATNIANSSNEDYKSIDAKIGSSVSGDRVELKIRENDYETDLTQEIPETMETKAMYTANLQMIKAKDEMLGETIDLMA